MAVNWDYTLRGVNDSNDTYDTLKKKVGQFATRTGRSFFIGKASGGNKPEARWQDKYRKYHIDYERDNGSPPRWGAFTRMIVLCETENVRQALNLEKKIVDYYKEKGRNIANPISGGGGRLGVDPGYVYLVLSEAADDEVSRMDKNGNTVWDMLRTMIMGNMYMV